MFQNKNDFNLFYFLYSKNKEEINESRDMKNLIIWKSTKNNNWEKNDYKNSYLNSFNRGKDSHKMTFFMA